MNPIESIVSRFLANTTHRESLVEVSRLIVETVELNIVREAVLLTKHNVRSAINTTILLGCRIGTRKILLRINNLLILLLVEAIQKIVRKNLL